MTQLNSHKVAHCPMLCGMSGRFRIMAARALTLLLLCSALAGASTFVDGVVATVGRDTVLYSDVMQEMFSELGDPAALGEPTQELMEQLNPKYQEALEREIEQRILFIEAETLGVAIPDDKIEERFAEVKKQFATQEAFRSALNSMGLTSSMLRDRIRRQMMAYTLRLSKQHQFEKDAIVTESDLAQYFQDHKADFHFESRYSVRRFFLKAPVDGPEREETKTKLEAIRMQVAEGADFGELAKELSQGPEASESGLIGWVLPGDLVEPLNSAMLALTSSELSDVLETEFGFHFLRVEEIQTEGTTPYEEARMTIEPLLRKNEAEEQYRRWLRRLRQRSDIRIMKDSIY